MRTFCLFSQPPTPQFHWYLQHVRRVQHFLRSLENIKHILKTSSQTGNNIETLSNQKSMKKTMHFFAVSLVFSNMATLKKTLYCNYESNFSIFFCKMTHPNILDLKKSLWKELCKTNKYKNLKCFGRGDPIILNGREVIQTWHPKAHQHDFKNLNRFHP